MTRHRQATGGIPVDFLPKSEYGTKKIRVLHTQYSYFLATIYE